MKQLDIFSIRDEEELLSSNMTEALNEEQDEFARLFVINEDEHLNDKLIDEFGTLCIFYELENCEELLKKIGQFQTIPAYKYILNYLMARYKLYIGERNTEGLWKYVNKKRWNLKDQLTDEEVKAFRSYVYEKISKNTDEFEQKDYELFLSTLLYYLKTDMKNNGGDINKNWKKYFRSLLLDFNSNRLNEMALSVRMEYQYYRIFRKKVLKHSEINFYNRECITMYLILNYASLCGEYRYFDAFKKLTDLYPMQKSSIQEENLDTTKMLGEKLFEFLELNGSLKPIFRKTLFCVKQDPIAYVYGIADINNSKMKRRTAQRMFLEQWKIFENIIERYEERNIFQRIEEDRKRKSGNEDITCDLNKLGKQKIYQWMYGVHVIERAKNKNIDIKEKDMYLFGERYSECSTEHFLDSKEFLATRIRDNTFSEFPQSEERQRNLLVTLLFLNFVMSAEEGGYVELNYLNRLQQFEYEVNDVLCKCGFQLLYSGNAYDAFIKFLLAYENSIEVFKSIWFMKTKSKE